MKYIFSSKAEDDFKQIYRYITQESVLSAERVIANIETTCDALSEMPEMGKKSEFVNDLLIRVFPVKKYGSYLIFYKITSKQLIVVRILHSAQDIPNIF